MKKILNIILIIISLPMFILLSPYIWFRFFTSQNINLFRFLTYGRTLIGGYHGKLKIGTNINNVIYETENFDIEGKPFNWIDDENRNITQLLKMRVYCYWVENDYLFIKVFRNDKLIKKHNETNLGVDKL